MIKGFRLYVVGDTLKVALLEYGEDEITLESITKAISNLGIEEFDSEAIGTAFNEGVFAEVAVMEFPPGNIPGTCWVSFDDEGETASINIHPPNGAGKIISEWDIKDELKKAGCDSYFKLDDIIHRNAEAHRSSRSPVVFKAAEKKPAEVTIEVPDDRKKALLTYKHPYAVDPPTPEEVLQKVADAGVTYGLDEEKVRAIVEANIDVTKQVIATGKDPVRGVDAKLEYLFDAFHEKSGPRIREDGTADFRDLHLFENVDKDTPLVKKIPATPGEEGTDVCGNPIKPEPGKDMALPKGKGTVVVEDDENVLVAEVGGAPKLVSGRVDVDEVLTVDDVDFSTGNIDFHGNVMVKGVVNTGFSIVASGDITCQDTVEGAHLDAGGSIFLKHGIKGMGKSVVHASGNVMARFIERCVVQSGASVIVDEALIHSDTSAFDTVEVTNSKGCIFGGHVRAGNLVRASFIGSEMAITTEVEVGVTPQIREELKSLNDTIKKKKNDYEKLSKNFIALSLMREKFELPAEREEMYQELSSVTTQLKDEIEEMSTKIASLENDLKQCAEGRVEARTILYPGVSIVIKNAKRKFMGEVHKAVVVKNGPDIEVSEEVAKPGEESRASG